MPSSVHPSEHQMQKDESRSNYDHESRCSQTPSKLINPQNQQMVSDYSISPQQAPPSLMKEKYNTQYKHQNPLQRTIVGVVSQGNPCVVLSLATLVLSSLSIIYLCLTEFQVKTHVASPMTSPSFLLLLSLLGLVLIESIFGFNKKSTKRLTCLNYLWAITGLLFASYSSALGFQGVWDLDVIQRREVRFSRSIAPGFLSSQIFSWTYRISDQNEVIGPYFPWWSFFSFKSNINLVDKSAPDSWLIPPLFRIGHSFWTSFGKDGAILLPPVVDQWVISTVFAVLCAFHFFGTRKRDHISEAYSATSGGFLRRFKVCCSKRIAGPRVIRLIACLLFINQCSSIMIDHTSTDVLSHTVSLCNPSKLNYDTLDYYHPCWYQTDGNSATDDEVPVVIFSNQTIDQTITPYLKQIGMQENQDIIHAPLPGNEEETVINGRRLEDISVPVFSDEEGYKSLTFISPWILSSLPGVWALIIAIRLLMILASLLTMFKNLQGGIASLMVIAASMAVSVFCLCLSWHKVLDQVLGPITTSIDLLDFSTADMSSYLPYPYPLADIYYTIPDVKNQLRSLVSVPSLSVSEYASFKSRSFAGLFYCMDRVSRLLLDSEARSEAITRSKIAQYCQDWDTSARWRASSSWTLFLSVSFPFVVLIILLLANIYLADSKPNTLLQQQHPDYMQEDKHVPDDTPSTEDSTYMLHPHVQPYASRSEGPCYPGSSLSPGQNHHVYPVYLPHHKFQSPQNHSFKKKSNQPTFCVQDITDGTPSSLRVFPITSPTGSIPNPRFNRMAAQEYSLQRNPHYNTSLFSNNYNFGRTPSQRPLVRGYTPSLTPRSSYPNKIGNPAQDDDEER